MSNANGAPLNFNAANVKPDEGRVPVPAGWYNATITESEMKPTKDNEGSYLNVSLTILDGAHAGRKLFDRMNLANKSAVAVEIGQARLSAYCHATGVIQLASTAQLHNIPIVVKVRLKPADGQYDESNEISAVKAIGSVTGGAPAPGAAAPAAAGGPAWLQPGAAATAAATPAPAADAAPVVAPAPAPAPAPVAAPAPAPVAAAPVKTMTAKANGASYETFVAAGWTDQMMIEQEYMTISTPAPAAAPAPAAPAPAAPAPAATPAPTAGGSQPPWVR